MKLTTWLMIAVLIVIAAFFVTGKASYLITPLGIPGALINILILGLAAILVYKLVQKVLMVLLIPLIILFIILLYATVVIQAPIQGTVYNALGNQPLLGVVVEQTIYTKGLALHPISTPEWSSNTTTTESGTYSFPWSVHLTFPFVEYFDQDNVEVRICPNCPNSPLQAQFHNITGQTSGIVKSRFNFLVVQSNIYLIPRISPAECQQINISQLSAECVKLNS